MAKHFSIATADSRKWYQTIIKATTRFRCFGPLKVMAYVLVVLLSAAPAIAALSIEPLAVYQDVAPGVSGATYSSLPTHWAHSSRDGRFSWQASLSNGQEGLWGNDRNGTRLLALAGAGANYPGIFEQPSGFINSSGNFTLVITSGVDEFDVQQVVVTDGITERVVFEAGTPAPGLAPGLTIVGGSVGVAITDSDVLKIRSALSGPEVNRDNNNSWWVGPPENIRLLIREGDPAPGLPGEFVGGLVGSGARINDSGYAVIADKLASGVIGNAVWAGTPGDLDLIAFRGLPAPQTDGLVFGLPGSNAVTEADEIVLIANFDDPSTGLSAGSGLYLGPREDLQLIIGPNSTLPLLEDDFELHLTGLRINRTGNAALFANLSDESGIPRRAILKVDLEDVSQSIAIVAVGDEAPGSDETFTSFGMPQINDRGDMLFAGALTGFEEPFRDHGIWMKPVDGPLELVALEGQNLQFNTSSGLTTRTVDRAFIATSLTNEGSVGIGLRFTDSSIGLFAARQLVVPEPSTLLLTLSVAGGLVLWRRIL